MPRKTLTRSASSSGPLQTEIRRQFASAGVARFLRSLPVFEVDKDSPKRLRELLAELDRVEADKKRTSRQ